MFSGNWIYRRQNPKTLFVYKKGEMLPVFKFTSKNGCWPFSGHGYSFKNRTRLIEFVENSGNFVAKKEKERATSG